MSVQYNIATLLREPVGSTREYDIESWVLIDEEAPRSQQVTGHTALLRTKQGVLVTAHLQGVERQPCSRCLRQIDVPVRMDIEEEFFASVDPETGARLPAPDNPEAFRIDTHHTMDLEEAVRQYWTAALPMQPLCRPDCRGLCPRCGQDLNEGACSCPPETDERWSALRKLVKETKGK